MLIASYAKGLFNHNAEKKSDAMGKKTLAGFTELWIAEFKVSSSIQDWKIHCRFLLSKKEARY